MTRIVSTDLNFEREPMRSPWGFKGGFLTEAWQTVVSLHGSSGCHGLGLGLQSVLWSDPDVFASCSESAGNAAMLLLTQRALREARRDEFDSPLDLLDRILPEVYAYGKSVTGRPNLRLTFALNALVAVDSAAWLLYAAEHGVRSFDELVPEFARQGLGFRNTEVASVPAIGYTLDAPAIIELVNSGYALLKIKIGSDPEKDGDAEKMLAWDIRRMEDIHRAVGDRNNIRYYLDANGRYDSLDRVMRFVDALGRMGALEQTLLFEEPFAEELRIDVSSIPIRVVADESAHSDRDVIERIDLGYGAIALKPIAKTLSMTFRMVKAAFERNVPCFCADLTVNPVMVDWNKTVAARLKPLPGLSGGALENNGFQNYRNWSRMLEYHPSAGGSWVQAVDGAFHLGSDFYSASGGIFEVSPHYRSLVR